MKLGNTAKKLLITASFFLPCIFYICAELCQKYSDERLLKLFFIFLWVLSCARIMFFLSNKLFKSTLKKVWKVVLFIFLLAGFWAFILLTALPGYYLFHT